MKRNSPMQPGVYRVYGEKNLMAWGPQKPWGPRNPPPGPGAQTLELKKGKSWLKRPTGGNSGESFCLKTARGVCCQKCEQ